MVKNNKQKYLILLIVLICIQLASAKTLQKTKPINTPNDLELLNYRITNYVYIKSDIGTINKYIKKFLLASDKKVIRENMNLINVFSKTIELVQLPKEQLVKLNRYAIAYKSYNFSKSNLSSLNNILWWSAVRQISDKNELQVFLNNQMLSDNFKKALKIYVEKGMVDEILNWSKKLDFDNSELIFEISLRQAKIRKILIENPVNITKLLVNELRLSIAENLPMIEKKGASISNHLIWLIKQFGVFRDTLGVKQILSNLVEDDFYYNRDIFTINPLSKLPLNKRKEYISVAKERLIVGIRAQEALNPHIIIKSNVIE